MRLTKISYSATPGIGRAQVRWFADIETVPRDQLPPIVLSLSVGRPRLGELFRQPVCGSLTGTAVSAPIGASSMIDVEHVYDVLRVVDAVADAVLTPSGAPLAREGRT